jgi:transcriptional regulator with XRE-family HTH domain
MSRKKSAQLGILFETGKRIREIRGSLTQAEFGKIFDVGGSAVSRWEDGRLSDDETLKKIANFGGVTLEWLLRGAEAPQQAQDFVPEPYDTRPAELNSDYLAAAIKHARQYLKTARLKYTIAQEANLITYLYEYWQEHHGAPGLVVTKRLAELAQKKQD